VTIGTAYGPLGEVTGKERECNCNETFRTAEDYRDHLPCQPSKDRLVFEIKTMYMRGTTDGYTHSHGPPFYRSFAAAKLAGEQEDGGYAVDPKPVEVIELHDGRIYIIDGPHKTVEMVQEERVMRKAAWNKLTPAERELLGLKKEPK